MWLSSALSTLLWPARCGACDAPCDEGAALCETCGLSLDPIVPAGACRLCGLPVYAGPLCGGCLGRAPPWSRAWAPFSYGAALAQAIRRLKWDARPDLARPLARLLGGLGGDADLVVPVPLHPRRLRARGYNQAALLALAMPGGLPIELGALLRTRDTRPQTELEPRERRANVRGAFRARPERLRGRRVLLVDDVLTTGATAEACTRALLDAGAAGVGVLTVARAVP